MMTNTIDQAPTLVLGSEEQLTFTTAGETSSDLVNWFAQGLRATILRLGHLYRDSNSSMVEGDQGDQQHTVRLVINLCDIDKPRSVQRRG